MVSFDELLIGEVTRFDNRPSRMYGWLTVTETYTDDKTLIGTTVWFHYNDGEFLRADDNYIWWNGIYLPDPDPFKFARGPIYARLALPKVGDKLAFVLGENDKGPKAEPWTHEDHLKSVAIGTGSELRITMDDDIIWWGLFHEETGLVRTLSGALPEALLSEMIVEWYYPDDIADGSYGESYPIPGYWEVVGTPPTGLLTATPVQ